MGLTNIYTQFKKLYKTDLTVVTVTAIDAVNGVSTVQDLNGLSFLALGTSVSPGNKAYVKDGQIQGTAPSLSLFEVWV